MTALEVLRGRLALLRTALAEADLERAEHLLDAVEDDVCDVEQTTVPRRLAYAWLESGIESDEAARELRIAIEASLFWIVAHRELGELARSAIEARFPGEAA